MLTREKKWVVLLFRAIIHDSIEKSRHLHVAVNETLQNLSQYNVV